MDLTFLEASVPLTKTFKKTKDGIEKAPYPNVTNVTSHKETTVTIAGMYDALVEHAAAKRCLLKGNTVRDLSNESRAASTMANEPTSWICLDIDGLKGGKVSTFLTAIGIKDTSHIIQYSASQDITSKDLRCHVFVWLSKPCTPALLKQWLIHLNTTVPMLQKGLQLTRTNLALRYPLDVTTCQNDKLLYISAPTLIGIKDPFSKRLRIELVEMKKPVFDLDQSKIPSPEANRKATQDEINALRTAKGLATRSVKTKVMASGIEVMAAPDHAVFNDIKRDRGFVYFNLNGGDSWGYYHPENNPDYIHNFKGEPSYRTKELLPEYWATVVADREAKKDEVVVVDPAPVRGEIRYLAFLDRKSSSYYRGEYNETTGHLSLDEARNETQVKHFLKQHGLPVGDFIPEWRMVYDPASPERVNVEKKLVNLFEPSEFMRAVPVPRTSPPPTIFRVLHHALGNNEDITRHFINWLAFIIQRRTRTLTAWVLHGTTKTGKGILMHRIIKPLLGDSNCVITTQEMMQEKFNVFMERSLLVFIDEMEHMALDNSRAFMAKMKHVITEEMISIRDMRKTPYQARNYCNFISASNRPNSAGIDREDRRMNVANFQNVQIDITQDEINAIAGELQHFHDFLMLLEIDEDAVRTPLITEDRDQLISMSETTVDSVIYEINRGNFQYLVDQMPTDDSYKGTVDESTKVDNYISTLETLIRRTSPVNGVCNIGRDELFRILDHIIGKVPVSPGKFTSMLKHHKQEVKNVWIPEREQVVKGIGAAWTNFEMINDYLKILRPERRPLKAVA